MAKAGAMCRFGKPRDGEPIVVAEGVATALSIREALARRRRARRATVFVAFDCPNLAPRAVRCASSFPSPIVFCADDDWQTDGNPGRRRRSRSRRSSATRPCAGLRGMARASRLDRLQRSARVPRPRVVREQLRPALQRVAQGISTPKSASAKIVDDNDAGASGCS
jgi:hypothetical protein